MPGNPIRNVTGGGQIFWCPGCDSPHQVNAWINGPKWTYNNDPVKPTFSPSILVTYDGIDEDTGETMKSCCHSFVTDGNIQFLGDCTHKLKGSTVQLLPWPYAPNDFGGVED